MEKEEDIDIKIRSVSNWKFRFQIGNFGFKVKIFVSNSIFLFQSAFLPLKSAKITGFVAPRGVMTNAAYIENGVGGISVFVSCDNRRREYLSQCSLRAGTHT